MLRRYHQQGSSNKLLTIIFKPNKKIWVKHITIKMLGYTPLLLKIVLKINRLLKKKKIKYDNLTHCLLPNERNIYIQLKQALKKNNPDYL